MVKNYKITFAAVVVLIFFILSVITIIDYVGSFESGGTLRLSEYPEDKLDLGQVVNISEDDFKKYSQLKELFSRINSGNDDSLNMGNIKFIGKAEVYGRVYDEI